VPGDLLRLSIGPEAPEDLLADLEGALTTVLDPSAWAGRVSPRELGNDASRLRSSRPSKRHSIGA
jgi:hypothetical protein